MSTRACFACVAFRMRVSMSAIGSVIFLNPVGCWFLVSGCWSVAHRHAAATKPQPRLPAALDHSSDFAVERQLAEAEAAQGELAHVGARAPAELAAIASADGVLGHRRVFHHLGGCSHISSPYCCA